jgi:hypothetical protein
VLDGVSADIVLVGKSVSVGIIGCTIVEVGNISSIEIEGNSSGGHLSRSRGSLRGLHPLTANVTTTEGSWTVEMWRSVFVIVTVGA